MPFPWLSRLAHEYVNCSLNFAKFLSLITNILPCNHPTSKKFACYFNLYKLLFVICFNFNSLVPKNLHQSSQYLVKVINKNICNLDFLSQSLYY